MSVRARVPVNGEMHVEDAAIVEVLRVSRITGRVKLYTRIGDVEQVRWYRKGETWHGSLRIEIKP